MAAVKPIRAMTPDRLKIFSGTANPCLAQEICASLGLQLGDLMLETFSDGEVYLQYQENVRGADLFLIQPTCRPVDHNLMELLLMIDAAKRASADRIMALDLHAAQIQGFFDVPVDHLFSAPVMIEYFKPLEVPDLTVVSPDPGGVERARAFGKRMNAPLAIIDKRREKPNVAEVMNVVGWVEGRNCLMVDDLIDTAGTLVKGAEALLQQGARSVSACATHAVLSGPAVERIEASPLKEVVFTNSIPLSKEARHSSKIKFLSVAPLLARAIQSIHEETSVSSLFV